MGKKRTHIFMEIGQKEALKKEAEKLDILLSELIRRIFEKYLKGRK